MKRITIILCTVFFLSACNDEKTQTTDTKESGDTTTTSSSTSTSMANEAMPDSATMMKNWQTYMTPGDVHKMMESWSGTWDGDVTMWHAPGAPPEKSKSTSQNKMVMGGRYQVSNHKGNMMGMPFEGMSTVAYDNAKKVFINTWIDNMGSGMMVMEGPWDEASKTMTLKGKVIDPGAGNNKEMEIRETFKIIDDNTQMMEMFSQGPDGKEFKMMEIKYTRKK